MGQGKLITFEGPEGAGKTTQARLCVAFLLAQGKDVLLTREPGGTPCGEKIRTLLLLDEENLDARAEALLYLAARAQHVATVIKPALATGRFVVCDRFSDSTLAYQGYGRGLDLGFLNKINTWVTGGIKPDLTFLLDLRVEEGFVRLVQKVQDHLEKEDLAFHRRVRRGYLALAQQEPERIKVIPAGGKPEEVFSLVQEKVYRWLKEQEGKENVGAT